MAGTGNCADSMDNHSSFEQGLIPSLNGWRAVAITLVMLDHEKYAAGFPTGHLPNWGWHFFEQGNLGVRMFFVLSGFLITHLLLSEGEKTTFVSLKNFFIRRCLRILPVYLIYLGVLTGLIGLKFYGGESVSAWAGALTFTRNMLGPVTSYTGHFWSLAVEEQFYLTWPICLAALTLWRRPQLAVLLLLIPIFFCPLVRLAGFIPEANGEFLGRVFGGNSVFVYADSLAMGCLGALLRRHISPRLTPATALAILMVSVAVIVSGAYGSDVSDHRVIWACIPSIQAIAILVAMWISTYRECRIAYPVLNWKPVNTVGILSYSLYIWHVMFLSNASGTPLLAVLYSWRSWWLVSLAVAALSYYGLERPAVKLKMRLSV